MVIHPASREIGIQWDYIGLAIPVQLKGHVRTIGRWEIDIILMPNATVNQDYGHWLGKNPACGRHSIS